MGNNNKYIPNRTAADVIAEAGGNSGIAKLMREGQYTGNTVRRQPLSAVDTVLQEREAQRNSTSDFPKF